jgi:hypothetical protein
MSHRHTLRLQFPGGVSNDYRLRGTKLEFRQNEGTWRVLDESKIQMHFRFNTEVARWLQKEFLEKNPFAPLHSWERTGKDTWKYLDMPDLVCISTHSCKCSTCNRLIEAPPTHTEQDAMRHMVREFERHVHEIHAQHGSEAASQAKSAPERR